MSGAVPAYEASSWDRVLAGVALMVGSFFLCLRCPSKMLVADGVVMAAVMVGNVVVGVKLCCSVADVGRVNLGKGWPAAHSFSTAAHFFSAYSSAPVTFDQLSGVLSACPTVPYHCHPRMRGSHKTRAPIDSGAPQTSMAQLLSAGSARARKTDPVRLMLVPSRASNCH